MSTTQLSPFANPASQPQPSVAGQFPGVSTMIPTNLSQLTPGMQAIAAYRARGGRALGGNTMGGLGTMMGAQGGGAGAAGLQSAQAAQGDITPSAPPTAAPDPYASARGTMGTIRPPGGYRTGNPGLAATMGAPSGIGMPPVQMQGPPNAGAVRVGRIRPPSRMAYNSRF